MIHKPVLIKDVLKYLNPKPNENFIDATIGQAGHALLLLEKNGPGGRVLGIDLDAWQIENSKARTIDFSRERDPALRGSKRVILVNDSYVNIKEIALKNNFKTVNGILLDLGYSSWQLENSTKGFSFQKDELLDMRYDLKNPLTARKIVNEYQENEIAEILKEYGQERFAKKIAKEIIKQRKIKKIESTFQLKNIIEKVVPAKLQYAKIHCATRSFQALRIAVNDELGNLTRVLPDAFSILSEGGRLVVISFHSLEDKIVKNFFKEKEQLQAATILTPKPIMVDEQEISLNIRSRSAKLRAIVKLSE